VDAVRTSLVAGGSDDAALAAATDDDGPAAELGPAEKLDRRVERVHVDVEDVSGARRVGISQRG
jgi:hypothetical protein